MARDCGRLRVGGCGRPLSGGGGAGADAVAVRWCVGGGGCFDAGRRATGTGRSGHWFCLWSPWAADHVHVVWMPCSPCHSFGVLRSSFRRWRCSGQPRIASGVTQLHHGCHAVSVVVRSSGVSGIPPPRRAGGTPPPTLPPNPTGRDAALVPTCLVGRGSIAGARPLSTASTIAEASG